MEPTIRNVRDVFDGTRARLVTLDDNPFDLTTPLNRMDYYRGRLSPEIPVRE